MQRIICSRNLSLALAATLLMSAAAVRAQSENSPSSDSGPGWQLAGATARLDHTLDTKTAKQGERVEAKLADTVKAANGTMLPRGTQLLGTITAVAPYQNDNPSRISLRFDQARMQNGKTLPVKVTVIGAYPGNENQLAIYDQQTMGSAPRHVPAQDQFTQQPGTLSHVTMTSRVSGHNSATFSDNKGDVKLEAGTFLQVGIAPRQNNASSSAGM